MKSCELCGCAARMYCESDQASLCWNCDEKVHCANFLVAKHCRSLLCQVCQSLTPWKASGPKLGPTVSICQSCFSRHNRNREERGAEEEESHTGDEFYEECDDEDADEDEDDDGSDDGYVGEDDEEDGENQVVPWSGSASPHLPPVASSSSSEDEISSRFGDRILKRMRDSSADLDSDDEIACSSSYLGSRRLGNEEGSFFTSFRPLKQTRTGREVEEGHDHDIDEVQGESRSTAIIDSLKRQQSDMITNGENASATIHGISRLSRDQGR